MRALALILVLAAASPAAAAPAGSFDEDFEPVRADSIALGPCPSGRAFVSLDIGWLRSELRANLGLAANIDLFIRAETMLLYDAFDSQSGLHIGLRFSPFPGPGFRVSLEASAGEILIPIQNGTQNLATFRGDLLVGTTFLGLGTAYGRVTVRGITSDLEGRGGLVGEQELGLGVEHAFGRRIVVGAEGFLWTRAHHAGYGQWRLRVGVSL